jgi:hypothetical protein
MDVALKGGAGDGARSVGPADERVDLRFFLKLSFSAWTKFHTVR